MKIRYDFSALWGIANQLGASRETLILTRSSAIESIDDRLANSGIEVALSDIDNIGGLLSYENRQVLLYIPDQAQQITAVINGEKDNGKKFHVAHCSTIKNMKADGRFERYIATTNISGKFHVHGIDIEGNHIDAKDVALYVCQVCLKTLNYKQAKVENSAKKIRDQFDLTEFFETYTSIFPYMPRRSEQNIGVSGYSSDWDSVSRALRNHAKWHCSDCGVNLSGHQNLLHVHHRDGVKSNNNSINLLVLCAACHRNQPMHGHMHVSYKDMKTINQLRRQTGLISNDWRSVLKMVDPAFLGILGLAKARGWPPPELESTLDAKLPSIEVSWPNKMVAISLADKPINIPGWRVMKLLEAFPYFS